MSIVYVVEALRWFDRENHSYVVCVTDDYKNAVRQASAEDYHRGGKYNCVITEFTVNESTLLLNDMHKLDVEEMETVYQSALSENSYPIRKSTP